VFFLQVVDTLFVLVVVEAHGLRTTMSMPNASLFDVSFNRYVTILLEGSPILV
jgi:hypothetical protein